MCAHLIDIQDNGIIPKFKHNLNIFNPTSKKSLYFTNGHQRHKFIIVGQELAYFVKKETKDNR